MTRGKKNEEKKIFKFSFDKRQMLRKEFRIKNKPRDIRYIQEIDSSGCPRVVKKVQCSSCKNWHWGKCKEKTFICYVCGQSGHIARNCPQSILNRGRGRGREQNDALGNRDQSRASDNNQQEDTSASEDMSDIEETPSSSGTSGDKVQRERGRDQAKGKEALESESDQEDPLSSSETGGDIVENMTRRGRIPRHHELPEFRDDLRPPLRRGHVPIALNPMEEEIAIRHDEIRRLRDDNHLLVEGNVALRREIAAIKEELHALGQLITRIRADKEAQAVELIQKAQNLEAEVRGLEPLKSELLQLRSESQKLDALRKEMSSDVQNVNKEIKRLKTENQQILALRSEIEGLHQELAWARSAYEYEKKANADQIEQRQVLEKNVTSMGREVEKLRVEKMSLEKRSRGSGPGAYGDPSGGEMGRYDSGLWSSYVHRSFPRH